MLADVPYEVEKGVVLHPFVIVDKFGLVRGVGVEVEYPGKLGADPFYVMPEGLLVQEIPFLGLHRRVAYHPGRASDKCERFVPAVLEMLEYHYTDQVPDVQGVSCRVNPDVSGLRAFHEFLLGAGHDVLDHSPPFEFFNEILLHMLSCNLQ